jgi:hypothetical protein
VLLGSNDVVKDNMHRTAGILRVEGLATAVRNMGREEPLAAHPDLVAEAVASSSWLIRHTVPGNVVQEGDTVAMASARVLRAKPNRTFFDEFDLATLELEAGALDEARSRFEALSKTGRLPYRIYGEASDPLFYLGRMPARTFQRGSA